VSAFAPTHVPDAYASALRQASDKFSCQLSPDGEKLLIFFENYRNLLINLHGTLIRPSCLSVGLPVLPR